MIIRQFSDLYHIDKDTQHLKNETVTLESMQQLDQHKVIIFEGHGFHSEEFHSCLLLGESCSLYTEFRNHLSKISDGESILEDGVYLTSNRSLNGHLQFAVGSPFLDRHLGEMPNSIVFLGACYTMKDDTLAQTFINHGARAVIGYSESVSMEYEMQTRMHFFYTLTQEQHGDTPSVLQALTETRNRIGQTDAGFVSAGGAEMRLLAKDGDGHSVTLRSIFESDVPAGNNPEPTPTPELFNVYEQLPEEFVFASGAGGWATIIQLQDEGSFTGQYHDSDPNTQPEYPNGSVSICDFKGQFSAPTRVSEYIYSTKLLSITQERPTGEVYYQDGFRYLCADPYGFDDADEFLIILPGASISDLPEEFLGWVHIHEEITTMPEGLFGLYNVSGQEGFSAVEEHSVWTGSYEGSINGNRVTFWASYSTPSHVTFFQGGGPAVMDQCFVWKDSDQTMFQASDWERTTFSTITLEFNEDLSAATLTMDADSNVDLSPWGGTPDGKLSIRLTRTENP